MTGAVTCVGSRRPTDDGPERTVAGILVCDERPITGLTLSQAFGAFVSVSDIDWVSDGFALAGCIRGGSGADRVPGRPGRRRPGHGPLVGGRPTAPKIARLPGG